MYNPENNLPRMWSRDQVIELLKEVVRVELSYEDNYVRDNGRGGMYEKIPVVKLYIDGEEVR